MVITSIRIKVLKTSNKMVGIASINLDNMFAIHGIKILKGPNDLFLAMPSRSKGPGQFEDIVHPINSNVRTTVEKLVFHAYNYCIREKLHAAQFEITNAVLLNRFYDQEFNQFEVTIRIDDTTEYRSNASANVQNNGKPKKKSVASQDNAFWDWLNN